ncbi:MAG: hypothetical protein KME47_07770 [Nodosilinea sp. WJT8-NPBG4]|jgi:hypothetical protein|nr:hypothetical protein [Nodosilinea sp. WJT8-NPBG4]
MSGATIPYHLRQNKAVDRYAFMELLSKVDRFCDVSKYQYVGFGGHSLEDFKYIHNRFGISSMTSIERDEEVYKRQQFNLPHNCINCLLQDSNDFVRDFIREERTIIWLDYTKPAQLGSQIAQFQSIIDRFSSLDIIKITLNAHASSYVEANKTVQPNDTWNARIKDLEKKLGNELFPFADISPDMMTARGFPNAIHLIVKYAANLAMRGDLDIYFQPLTSFSYNDGQEMLTVTGILLEKTQSESFFNKTGIDQWELGNVDWKEPTRIDMPDLTIKERMHIDTFLPNFSADLVHEKLGFLINQKESISLEMLKTYVLFYRQSPYFSRIFV